MKRKSVILFLCTGNSCRSQMAEGFARVLGVDKVEVYSAGIEPAGLNPRAVAAMNEVGIDISGHSSDPINPDILKKADVIITLCGDARDKCPVTPRTARNEHWPLIDPAQAKGGEEAIMAIFRAVREEIRERVINLLGTLETDGC
ncbi:MAG: arsenate reductase (thioredoxin) [Bacillota bacterium]